MLFAINETFILNFVMLNKLLLSICFILSLQQVWAIKARQELSVFTQPNGYALESKLRGDEFFHYRLSTDNYTLLQNAEGYLVYAIEKNGELTPSTVIAHNMANRTESERLFLETIPTNLSFSPKTKAYALQKRIARSSVISTQQKRVKALTKTVTSPRYLVLLVNFSDNTFSVPTANTRFSSQFNADSYTTDGATGSVRKYFSDNSMGVFNPQFDVYGPVTLSNTMAYYGDNDSDGNDVKPDEMVFEACELLNNQIDFSMYDLDNDGVVDNVYVIYAGYGEASGAPESTIWPHKWEVQVTTKLDNKQIGGYSCSSELFGTSGTTIDGIGTACHEFSHAIGLPDMYDTDYEQNGQSFDVDTWSLMAGGAYNNNSKTPPYFCAVERELLGWGTPTVLNSPANLTLNSIGTNQFYRINSPVSNEYFLIENRQKTNWDAHLYTHGMLVYHIDKTSAFAYRWAENTLNAYADHNCVDILEADGTQLIYSGTNGTDWLNSLKGDPFPGSASKQSITDNTTPNLKTWSGASTAKPITAITEINGIISFKVLGGENLFGAFEALNATNISNSGFTANWTPASNATKYLLNVYTKSSSSTTALSTTTGFDGFPTILPTNWSIGTTEVYTSVGNYGLASPSVKLVRSNQTITTQTYSDAITSISFWYKGNGLAGATSLKVEGSTDGSTWTEIENINSVPSTGTIKNINISSTLDYRKIRFIYTKGTAGNLGIDDIVIKYGQGIVITPVLNNLVVATGTSYNVVGLSAGDYYYTVKAANETDSSNESNEIAVSLQITSTNNPHSYPIKCWATVQGIALFSDRTQWVQIYSTTGQLLVQQQIYDGINHIALPPKSLYLVKTQAGTSKIRTL